MKKYEDALARIIADVLGLVFGTNIFTSHIPDGKEEGVAVILGTQIDENEYEVPKFNFQVVAKSPSRIYCQNILEKLWTEFPKYGAKDAESGISFDEILRRGNGAIVRATDSGKISFEMFFNMVAVFKNQ